jgi:hypothetical protein
MNKQPSLANIRAKAHDAPDHVFCCNLPLYILLEKRPRPDNPGWVEVGCWKQGNAEGMMVYLSLIDAMIDLHDRNRRGGCYQILPFESIDPRVFIDGHGGWFTVYLVYGYAARENRLLLDKRGELMSMTQGTHFRITPDMNEHFHLQFGEKVLAWLDRLHNAAGMPDYSRVVDELADATSEELDQHTRDALNRIEYPDTGQNDITHCGLYDPVEQRWRFATFADLVKDAGHS